MAMTQPQTRPLAGIRVLDLTNVLAGPFCAHQLAHLGADVIKVERPGTGDLARQLGADAALNARGMGLSFLAQNSGKRSVTLDLKSQPGRDVFLRLVATADVVIENFRPGVMDRLGLAYPVLRATQPSLIYCAISGFGQDGPLCAQPAYDQIIQGMSGTMSVTGTAETGPLRAGYPIADTIGGLTAAMAISAALASPHRGTFIDVSMLDSVLSTMGWVVSNYLGTGAPPTAMGNDNFTASPSGTFRTQTGPLNIAANKQDQFEALCHVIARPDLITDPRFAKRQDRLAHRAALNACLAEALAAHPADHWVAALTKAGVPAGPVLSVPEILAHPQIADRGVIATFEDAPEVGRDIRIARPGVTLDGTRPTTDSPPPPLGADTDAVLRELGLTPSEIETLRDAGTI